MAAEKQKPETGEEETDAEETEGGEKKGNKKLLLIIIVAVLFVAGAGGAGFFFLKSSHKADAPGEAAAAADEGHAAAASSGEHGGEHGAGSGTQYFELPDITVNLAASGNHFLRLKVVLEVASEADAAHLEQLKPRIIDDFQVYLRELRPDDLQGSAGSYRLRHDLLLRANQAAQPTRVQNVLFREFLVQ